MMALAAVSIVVSAHLDGLLNGVFIVVFCCFFSPLFPDSSSFCGDGQLWQPGQDKRRRERTLSLHEPEGETGRKGTPRRGPVGLSCALLLRSTRGALSERFRPQVKLRFGLADQHHAPEPSRRYGRVMGASEETLVPSVCGERGRTRGLVTFVTHRSPIWRPRSSPWLPPTFT